MKGSISIPAFYCPSFPLEYPAAAPPTIPGTLAVLFVPPPPEAPDGGTISNLFTISIAFLTFRVRGLKLGWI